MGRVLYFPCTNYQVATPGFNEAGEVQIVLSPVVALIPIYNDEETNDYDFMQPLVAGWNGLENPCQLILLLTRAPLLRGEVWRYSDDASSETIAAIIAELEAALSETTKRVQMERLIFDTSVDTAVVERTITQNEIARSRLRVKLSEFQHRLDAAREREFNAQREIEYRRLKALRDEIAKDWPLASAAINTLIDLFTRTSDFNRQNAQFLQASPSAEYQRLPPLRDPELVWRGLEIFSSSQPPLHRKTQLPDVDNTQLLVWPPRPQLIISPLVTGSRDIRYTADWHVPGAQRQRQLENERVDRELENIEQRKEFFRGY